MFKISDEEVRIILPYSIYRPNESMIFIFPAKAQRLKRKIYYSPRRARRTRR